MSSRTWAAALVGAAGLAVPVAAQDSVSPTPGLATVDTVSAWDASEQLNTFVVDLQEITSSRGNVFGVAPLLKASRSSATFTTSQISHNVVSNMTVRRPAPFTSYSLWNDAGFGVAPVNLPGTPVSPSGETFQLAAGFAEFGGNWDGIVGAVINYTAAEPKRLYVARAQVAANGASDAQKLASFGLGSVDASGNVYFRADGSGGTGGDVLGGNNIFRVRMLADGALAGRDYSALNVIDNNADNASSQADDGALDWIVKRQSANSLVPNNIPRERGQGVSRGVYVGATAGGMFQYEHAPLATTQTPAHLSGAGDHRSAVGFSQAAFFPGSVGTCGIILTHDGASDAIGVWGVDAGGAVSGARSLPLPSAITDNDPAATYTIPLVINAPDGFEFDRLDHYRGQTQFRGGPAVGVGSDQAGRLLATGVVYLRMTQALAAWPFQGISVARLAGPSAEPEGTWAAYVVPNPSFNPFDPNPNNRNPFRGKPFYNAAGEMIGELRPFYEVTSITGPSMSAGAIDSAGNVWFVSAYDRYDQDGNLRGDATTGLFRAVYDPETFSYRLELVLNNGAQIRGVNSNREYKITLIGLVNNNGGVSSSALFTSGINQSTWAGADRGSLSPDDPRTLGGLVLQANIIYDVNEDGQFDRLSTSDPDGPDQDYIVLLFLGGAAAGGGEPTDCNGNGIDDAQEIAGGANDCFNPLALMDPHTMGGADGVLDECQCVANWNRDGATNSNDISAFLTSWLNAVAGGPASADMNCDGATNSNDISAFLTSWLSAVQNTVPYDGCP